jgi:hypothetical protein
VGTCARVNAEPEGHVLAHAAMDVETGQIGVPTPTAELGALEAYPGPLALSPCYIGVPVPLGLPAGSSVRFRFGVAGGLDT